MARQLDNNDDYCFACGRNNPIGLHLDFKFDGDKYIAKKTVPREYQGYKDIVHGGIVTTMLDEAMGGFVIDRYKKTTVTGRLEVRYKLPTPTEQELTITAWQESSRHNIYSMRSTISTADGTITAEATAKMAVVDK